MNGESIIGKTYSQVIALIQNRSVPFPGGWHGAGSSTGLGRAREVTWRGHVTAGTVPVPAGAGEGAAGTRPRGVSPPGAGVPRLCPS